MLKSNNLWGDFWGNALYKEVKVEKIINARDINRKEYKQIYKGKLFCPIKGCKAILVHNDKQKGGVRKYFSTKPYSIHKTGCPNEVIHSGTKNRVKKVGTVEINLSEAHRKRILDESYDKLLKVLNSNLINNPVKKKKRKKAPGPRTDEDGSVVKRDIGGTPTVDGKGKDRIGSRQPYVYKREVSELREEDIGTTKEIHGFVESINIT